MTFVPHYAGYLDRARLHLGEAGIWLESAVETMCHEDWFEARELLAMIKDDIAPRLSELRDRAQEQPAEHRTPKAPLETHADRNSPPEEHPYVLNAPNTHLGRALIELHGGEDDSEQAARVVSKKLAAFEAGRRGRQDVEGLQNILIIVERAMDKFEAGADERQHIMAWLYLNTGTKPDALLIPTVGSDEYHRLRVSLGKLVLYSDVPEEDQ